MEFLRLHSIRITGPVLSLGLGLALAGCGPKATVHAASAATLGTAVLRQGRLRPLPLRFNGKIEPVTARTLRLPRIYGQGGPQTLITIAPNGTLVHKGEVVAEFDRTSEIEAARENEATYQDLAHQVDQQIASNQKDAQTNLALLKQAEATAADARLELRQAPILSRIQVGIDQANLADADAQVIEQKKVNALKAAADQGTLDSLIAQRNWQKLQWQRSVDNLHLLRLRSPMNGYVALKTIFLNGTLAHPQSGDQIFPRRPLMRIFDPQHMEVDTTVNGSDLGRLVMGMPATIIMDAFPNYAFQARLVSTSPIASAPMGTPVRNFSAEFMLLPRPCRVRARSGGHAKRGCPALMPDLTAAVQVRAPPPAPGILVPRLALGFRHGRAWVTPVTGQPQAVRVLGYDNQDAEITGPVRPGEQVQTGFVLSERSQP